MVLQGAGLFGGFDLENATSLRQLSSALDYWVSGGRDLNNVHLKDLTTHQRSGVEMINQRMDNSPLLKEIITRFLSVSRLEDPLLVTVGRDLIDFAVPGTYEPRSADYADAETSWRNRKPLFMPSNINPHHPTVVQAALRESEERERRRSEVQGAGPNGVNGVESNDDVDPEKERRNNEKQKESRADRLARAAAAAAKDYVSPLTEAPHRVYTGPSQRQPGRQLRPRQQHLENSPIRGEKDMMKVDQKLALALNKELNRPKVRLINKRRNTFADSEAGHAGLDGDVAGYEQEQRDQKSDHGLRSNAASQESMPPRRKGKQAVPSGSGHRPRKPRGYKAIDDGTLDREPAEVGVEDPSKLILDYNIIRDDPNNSGHSTTGIRVPNRYPHAVDFNSAASVKKLNTWRSQILGRNFPASRKTREHWLQIEKQLVLDLVKNQLETRSSIKWNKLANAFNRQMAGTIQRAGEKFCSRGTRILDALEEDRSAPWRTKSSIQGMCFKWNEYKTLLDAAIPEVEIGSDSEMVEEVLNGNSSTVIDSDDSDEMPDPHPEPPTEVKKRRRSATGSPSKKKKALTTKLKTKSRSTTHRVKRRKVEESEEEDEVEETEDEFGDNDDDFEDGKRPDSDLTSLPTVSDSEGGGQVFPNL